MRRGHQVTVISRPKAAPLVEQMQLGFRGIDLDQFSWPSDFFLWLAFVPLSAKAGRFRLSVIPLFTKRLGAGPGIGPADLQGAGYRRARSSIRVIAGRRNGG